MENKNVVEENKGLICIDLNESSNAKEFKSGDRVHQREFDRATQLIDLRISKAILSNNLDKDNNSRKRYNDTISILGSRGSGKTSFLLSLIKFYKDKEDNSKKKIVEVLDIIDPTLIEEKGHIFLTIISLIQESVCNKIDLNECSPNDLSYCRKKEWDDMLRKLADGLPSIDGVGLGLNDSNWQDAEYIMGRGLKSVKSATNLEANFNELVRCALKTLEKDALIIILDDIDVDFRKGWPVLETIRKYLTSPQIIVLLSGDLKLYSKAIRKQQWKNFGKALLKNEAESFYPNDIIAQSNKRAYNDLITEMEGQYLQKVIKPENRVHLTTLLEKVTTYQTELEIKILINNQKFNLLVFYKIILAEFGIRNEYQAEAYYSFLLSLPVRTQFQFLLEAQKRINIEVRGIDPHENSLRKHDNDNTNIIDAFLSDMYEKEVDVDLAKTMPKMLNIIILKLLLKEQLLSEAYQLQPTTFDTSLNSSLIALSFLFSQQAKANPYLIFDYFIKIGYVRNLLPNVGFAEKENRTAVSLLKPSIEGLCNHSGIFQDKVLKDVVGNMIAYIESTLISNEEQIGNVYLYGVAEKANASNDRSKGRIDYELKGKSSIQQILAFIPLTVSQNLIRNDTTISFSIYTLLASIGELIRKIEMDDMSRGLLELSQLRTYPMMSFSQGSINTSDIGELQGIEITKDNESSKLDNYLKYWNSKFPKKMYSPHVLGKIATRAHYAFNSIQKGQDIDKNLAEAIHRRLVALMNAILIEDVKENMPKCDNLNINNAVSSDTIFTDNLKVAIINKNKYDFSFSRWMLSCPLFLVYLKEELLVGENLINFIYPLYNIDDNLLIEDIDLGYLNFQDLKKMNVFATLRNVDVQKKTGKVISSLPKFSGAKTKARKTIEILRTVITFNEFMGLTLNEVKNICENSFAPIIANASISSLRGYIKENNLIW